MPTVSAPTVFAVTAPVSPDVAESLGDAESTRARVVVAAYDQTAALNALQVAGVSVFTSTFRRYGRPTADQREVAAATSEPGAVFAFSMTAPEAAPVRLSRH